MIQRLITIATIITFIKKWWIFATAFTGLLSMLFILRFDRLMDYKHAECDDNHHWLAIKAPYEWKIHWSYFESTAHWMQLLYREHEYKLVKDYHNDLGRRDVQVTQWLTYRQNQITQHRQILFSKFSNVQMLMLYDEHVGYVAHLDEKLVHVYIRGTQSIHEWALNFATHYCIFSNRSCVHLGYKYAVQDIRVHDSKLIDLLAHKKVILGGHSFGAGLGIALSEYFNQSIVYAMGSPCIGNKIFIDHIRKSHQIHLLTTIDDPVSVSEIQERAGYDCVLGCTAKHIASNMNFSKNNILFVEKQWNSFNWIVKWNNQTITQTLKNEMTVMDHLSFLKKTKQVWKKETNIMDRIYHDDSWFVYEPLSIRLLRRVCMIPFYGANIIGVHDWAYTLRDLCLETYLYPTEQQLEPLYFTHGIYASHPMTFVFYETIKRLMDHGFIWYDSN